MACDVRQKTRSEKICCIKTGCKSQRLGVSPVSQTYASIFVCVNVSIVRVNLPQFFWLPDGTKCSLISSKNHNAFTDLIRFRGKWLCCFREATDHASNDGTIRIIASSDGERWSSVGHLTEKGTDLRDPKLSINPQKRLVLIMGGSLNR